MKCIKLYLNTLIIIFLVLSLCEARGGRRGGSFGGGFGSWRKYKKPSTGSGSSRRIVSSSPVHTPITKALHEKKSSSNDKFQKNLRTSGYSNNYNTPPLPTGGSYYHNTAPLPGNAIYVAQAPPRGSEFGDFLTGYLTGRLLTMGFPTTHYYETRVYKDNSQRTEDNTKNSSSKFIIINRQQDSSTSQTSNETFFESTTLVEDNYFNSSDARDNSTQLPLIVTANPSKPYGVICVPMMINETSPSGDIVQTERLVCYPAPAPPTPKYEMKKKPVEIAGDITEH